MLYLPLTVVEMNGRILENLDLNDLQHCNRFAFLCQLKLFPHPVSTNAWIFHFLTSESLGKLSILAESTLDQCSSFQALFLASAFVTLPVRHLDFPISFHLR
jgi:hypothetical protein